MIRTELMSKRILVLPMVGLPMVEAIHSDRFSLELLRQ